MPAYGLTTCHALALAAVVAAAVPIARTPTAKLAMVRSANGPNTHTRQRTKISRIRHHLGYRHRRPACFARFSPPRHAESRRDARRRLSGRSGSAESALTQRTTTGRPYRA